jgi:hypothetical protein
MRGGSGAAKSIHGDVEADSDEDPALESIEEMER